VSKFGYLNQGNPIFIRDDEAQEMVNCKIDRGYLEFGEFKVNTGLYDAAPGRQVKLPNGNRLVIDPTARSESDGTNYAARGQVRHDDGTAQTKPFYVPVPTSACLGSLAVHHTVHETDYLNYGNGVSTTAGTIEYTIQLQDLSTPPGTNDVYYDKLSCFFEYITLDGVRLNAAQAVWRVGETGTLDAGKIIVTLAADPGAGKILAILFHHYVNYKRVFNQPGKYFYALTYFVVSQQLESPPLYLEVEITENDINAYSGEVFLKFTDLLVEDTVPAGLNPIIKIYRIPFGAEEYRHVADKNPGAGAPGIPFYDETPDSELGAILPTEGNTNLPLTNTDVVSIVLHKEKLFIATLPGLDENGGFVYYSKTGSFNEFPAKHFYHFNEDVVALAQFNEYLMIFTKTNAYVLYGNDEDSFGLSRIDFTAQGNFSRNSAQALTGQLFALAKSTSKKTDSVMLFNSRSALDISLPIYDILKTEGYTDNTALNASNKNRIIDNRFYVFELFVGNQNVKEETLNVVYDSIARGFCTYDDSYDNGEEVAKMLFKWRSKEFHVNGRVHGVQFNRWFYVRGKGKFTIEILGDGEQVTAHSYNLDAVSTEFFQVKSTRYTTFSVRIVGEQGAQIHDWGVGNGND
jgi:hypothetical protein